MRHRYADEWGCSVAASGTELASPRRNSWQRRHGAAVRKLLGEGTDVRAFAAGRANARWSPGATWFVAIFGGCFAFMLVLVHVILLPGALVGLLLFDTIRPRRGVAVTADRVFDLKLSSISARPYGVIATAGHDAVLGAHADATRGKWAIEFGGERVSVRERDLALLRSVVPLAPTAPQETQPMEHHSVPPIPPPPPEPGEWTMTQPVTRRPVRGRWREATFLWIVAHVCIGLAIFMAIIAISYCTAGVFGRDANQTSPSADGSLWYVFAAPLAGWMLFVYLRAALRTRVIVLSALAGSALLLACIVNVAYSPLVGH
jgi:hypothetical protein